MHFVILFCPSLSIIAYPNCTVHMNKSGKDIEQRFNTICQLSPEFGLDIKCDGHECYKSASHGSESCEVDLSSAVFRKVSVQLSVSHTSELSALLIDIWVCDSDIVCVCGVCVLQVAEQLMTIAYENGVNLFDTAEVYSAGKWVWPLTYSKMSG